MNMTNLRAANVARDQEWNTGSERVSMTFRATELAGEVGEACNVIKKLERERIGLVGSRDTKEHLAEELADIVICTDLVAMDADIDLDAAIAAKFNTTSEKNGLSTRLSKPVPVRALPFEATPEMVKAALDLVWEESETHDDLVSRLWRAMATTALNQFRTTPQEFPMQFAPAMVPAKMLLDAEAIPNLLFILGGCDEENPYMDGTMWVGTMPSDDGDHYGLHVYSNEYPEEGSITLASFEPLVASHPTPEHADVDKTVEGNGWLSIESAPKDGTVIDLWSAEFGRQPDCFWGKREHHCGEDGQYCDSDWHSEPDAWIDSAQNSDTFDDVTHWRPLPAPPAGEVA